MLFCTEMYSIGDQTLARNCIGLVLGSSKWMYNSSVFLIPLINIFFNIFKKKSHIHIFAIVLISAITYTIIIFRLICVNTFFLYFFQRDVRTEITGFTLPLRLTCAFA